MRTLAMIATLLAACSAPPMQRDSPLPDDNHGIVGPIIASGADWQLSGDPRESALSIYMDDGTEASGTWVSPYFVEGRISAGDIRVVLETAACEQNNIPYPMRARVTFPNHELTGCAAMRWDYQLSDLIDEIDACIAASPELRTVTYAGELPDSSTLVRMRDGDNSQDCRVVNGRATLAPRDENLAFATDHAAILLRARSGETENPGGECYTAPEAMVYSGHPATSRMVGWMLDPLGC